MLCFANPVLEKKGCRVQVIDYVPWYHVNRYVPFKNPVAFADEWSAHVPQRQKRVKWVKGLIRGFISYRHFPRKLQKQKAWRSFANRHLHLTDRYRTVAQLVQNPPQADLYIAGSDQLWNIRITDGFDEAYFLHFGDERSRRITYAVGADFAQPQDDEAVQELENVEVRLPELLSGIDAISLRETKCWDAVKAAAKPETPMCVCVDPTLLLPREAYETIEAEPKNAPTRFILTYIMPNVSGRAVIAEAERLSEKLGIPVVDVNGNPLAMNRRVKDHRICSPSEFLWYIHHADYVLTNSFHGTVFSVIYEKQFAAVPHSKFGNRISELLDKLGLSEQLAKMDEVILTEENSKNIFGSKAAEAMIEQPICFEGVREALSLLRAKSLAYLDENIAAAEKGQTDRDGE